MNRRLAAFTLQGLSTAEARNQHRDMLRRLGAARDTLWITELSDNMAERNRRAIWGAMNAPGEDAATSRDSLLLSSRAFRVLERVRTGAKVGMATLCIANRQPNFTQRLARCSVRQRAARSQINRRWT